jgi:hypothetical protein
MVIPVVVFVSSITEIQHLSCGPFPDIVRFIELGAWKDLIKPALTLGYYVG